MPWEPISSSDTTLNFTPETGYNIVKSVPLNVATPIDPNSVGCGKASISFETNTHAKPSCVTLDEVNGLLTV